MSCSRRRIIPIFIPNLGCGHECVFCDQRLISGEHKDISADDVRKICAEAMTSAPAEKTSAPAEVAFYGGSFTAIPTQRQNELLEAVKPFLDQNPQNSIRVSTRPDCIDRQDADRLKNFGVGVVELGAQSMCDDVLALSKRSHTADDVVRASGIIKDAGFKLILQMMTGLPGDTYDKSIYSAGRIIGLRPDGARVYPAVIVSGTELFNMWREGRYREHTVEEAVEWCAGICPLFDKAGIPVIRLGLNPSDSLSSGGAAAGAYHPAFGELVYSRIYYDKTVSALNGVEPGSGAIITVAAADVSKMTGQRRCNVYKLIDKFSLSSLKIVGSDIGSGEIMIEIMPRRVYNPWQ